MKRAKKFWRWLESPQGGAASSIILAVACLGLAGVFYWQASRTRDALCNFKTELVQTQIKGVNSLKQTIDFINARPNDPTPFGIDRVTVIAALKQNRDILVQRQKTIKALSSLHCHEDQKRIPSIPALNVR